MGGHKLHADIQIAKGTALPEKVWVPYNVPGTNDIAPYTFIDVKPRTKYLAWTTEPDKKGVWIKGGEETFMFWPPPFPNQEVPFEFRNKGSARKMDISQRVESATNPLPSGELPTRHFPHGAARRTADRKRVVFGSQTGLGDTSGGRKGWNQDGNHMEPVFFPPVTLTLREGRVSNDRIRYPKQVSYHS